MKQRSKVNFWSLRKNRQRVTIATLAVYGAVVLWACCWSPSLQSVVVTIGLLNYVTFVMATVALLKP